MEAVVFVTLACAVPAAFYAGWRISSRRQMPQPSPDHALQQEIESLRDEIWELKGAAAERDKAEAANEAKSRFLATVSHEMRTPLNGIMGMADLTRGANLTAEQSYYLEMIRASGGALASLIEEVLDFSRIEAGKLEIASAPFEITPLVERVVELLAPRAQGKGLEIASSIASDVPPVLIGDLARLQQVLINLAGNAVKFTDKGGVGLRVSRAPSGSIRFAISDTGPGIAKDRQTAIFMDFEQADGSATRRHEGTGLGLAISRRIAELMGGELRLEHSDATGSVFVCDLPLRSEAAGEAVQDGARLDGRQVLVVANSPFEGPWLGERLAESGAHVTRAQGEDEAIAKLDGGRPFDIVIVDCALGEETTKKLAGAVRAAGAGRSLVLFSPFERRAFGQQSLQDFDGWLVKPVRTASLIARLTDAFSKRPESPAAEPGCEAAGNGFSILLAEDNDINALIATKHLQRMGATVTRAADGTSALALAIDALEGRREAFDILLMDIRMPGFDGTEVARRVRSAETAAGLPRVRMIALTANAFDDDRRACLAAGFDEFLTKPVDPDKLGAVLAPGGAKDRDAARRA
jgi:signal transduction histidine kinase/CheY-like chemotaxis protein